MPDVAASSGEKIDIMSAVLNWAEVAIGVIFTSELALGTLLTPSEDLIEALFGGFRGLTLVWFVLGVLSVAVMIAFSVRTAGSELQNPTLAKYGQPREGYL